MFHHVHDHAPQAAAVAASFAAVVIDDAGRLLALLIAAISIGISLVRFRWDWEDRRNREEDRADARAHRSEDRADARASRREDRADIRGMQPSPPADHEPI